MEEEILEIVQLIVDGFKEKGYTQLHRGIAEKQRRYLQKKQDFDERQRKDQSRELLTDILKYIDSHLREAIAEAKKQQEMIKSIGEVFENWEMGLEKVSIDYGRSSATLRELQERSKQVRETEKFLEAMIKAAQEHGYLTDDEFGR